MARARRSLSALSWPLVNGIAGAGRFGPAGSGGGAVSFVIVVLLGGLMRIRRPNYGPMPFSSDDEAAGPGVPPAPFILRQKKRTGGEGASE
jgi:hypothetical protein